MNLPQRIEAVIRSWEQWSPAEHRHMDEIVEDILQHCRDGQGNRFVAEWCRRVLAPALAKS